MMMLKRRFIAGAVCPRCAKQDKIVMFDTEAGERVRECVACGFRDSLAEEQPAEELTTRVNQPRPGEQPLAHEDEVSVVQIIDGRQRRDH
jgi:uncharacterized metal-binding protein (TIGR02443 family)